MTMCVQSIGVTSDDSQEESLHDRATHPVPQRTAAGERDRSRRVSWPPPLGLVLGCRTHSPRTFAMTDLPAVRLLLRLLLNPGWAPLAVVVVHLVLAQYGLTQRFDHLLHFLGGASMAYFLFVLVGLLPSLFGGVPRWIRYLLAFTASCTVAVFWEFAEFTSDRFMGTSIQQSVPETVLDLAFGVAGALSTLVVIIGFSGLARPSTREARLDGSVNRSQPMRSETNPSSSVAGSHR